MSRLRVLWRTTAVRLSALYLLLFTLCALLLVIYVTAMSQRLLANQTREAVAAEVDQIEAIYDRTGVAGVLRTLERRARQPGANLYVIASPTGEILAGNVAWLEPGLLDAEGWTSRPFLYQRYSEESGDKHLALAEVVELPNGLHVLVGRDLQEPQKFGGLVRHALMVALGIMGVGALVIWFVIGRNALSRIDRMSHATTRIMAGDLSQRLPVNGSGDEFDRLSESLNAMLERIEKLNEGLRQVSDNIAHDLKTPLTRLRNRAEAALAQGASESDYRASLEDTITESDQLIRTFNALLMISRVEAGSAVAEMSPVDLSQSVEDCVELYEPLAEEQSLTLRGEAAPAVVIQGNRELIGQALGNLIDNAIKYAAGAADPEIRVTMAARADAIVISVSDHGPGIPADKREAVLQRFVRLDESRSKPGTGLGLSLVVAVMELHGGTLELSETTPDGGLTVSMIFPQNS
ncbi:two-component sensor histidine kinase [Xaviernesmea oryzae]|uniref:histidine kinase n=1 Tax=Xaviernesmea oryzae TaxID=464029 RepID=A0A1Q9B1I1_9HYPH|nr:HAMP domain-containing sensor histidine kinase [Xaviernesmea oryzae]OLP61871.1 two-component sensor histidine kinase [Xaviernesmea oryzae]SEL74836.1 Signal transduction histidine kinase [Xaviernesmea oryzae]